MPENVIREVLREQARARMAYRPAWTYANSGLKAPTRTETIAWARMLCGFRIPGRASYARAWVEFCLSGGATAPCHLAHRLLASDALHIRQRFSDADLFDPRDFAGVPF